ncbi:MAG: MarR family transcriptional regulator [Eubacterium sp.]|nr:MarR family transcriptional regulator [Eubacterium sp.]
MEQLQTVITRELEQSEIGKLSHELTYHKYLLNNDKIRSFFQKLSIPEYLAMHIIQESEQRDDIYAGRTYLKDIADQMQRPMRQTSRMVKALQERGLVSWSHDGDGSEGTYVTITDSGKKMLEEEEGALKKYYGKVIASYGRENLIQLLQLMKQLETVMGKEFEEMEETAIEEHETDE